MGFLMFLVAVAYIVLDWFIGKEFANIAAMKGHTEAKYFWWSFLMGPVGYAMVIALPTVSNQTTSAAFELPEL